MSLFRKNSVISKNVDKNNRPQQKTGSSQWVTRRLGPSKGVRPTSYIHRTFVDAEPTKGDKLTEEQKRLKREREKKERTDRYKSRSAKPSGEQNEQTSGEQNEQNEQTSGEQKTPQIIACAIGGPLEERKRRAALAQELFPKFRHLAQRVGSDIVDNTGFMKGVPGKVAFYPIPLSSAPCFTDADTSSVDVIDYAPTEKDDTLLMIGHTSFDPVISVEMLRGADRNSKIYVQGPGFNIGLATGHGVSAKSKFKQPQPQEWPKGGWKPSGFGESLAMLKAIKKDVKSFDAAMCPKYTQTQWDQVLALYNGKILELHQFGLGAFFTSRFDGSFYRQFGLATLSGVVRKRFEQKVVSELKKANLSAENKAKVAALADALKALGEDVFAGDAGKNKEGDKGKDLLAMYRLWPDNNLDGAYAGALMPDISKAVMSALKELPDYAGKGFDGGLNEFDGYVCHCMLSDAAGIPPPDAKQHLAVMLACVDAASKISEHVRLQELQVGLNKLLAGGKKITVMHDLGLDPMVDDFIALSILHKLL